MSALQINPVTPINGGPYLRYTYKTYRSCFQDESLFTAAKLVAFGAQSNQVPAGMIVAHIDKENRRSKVLSVFVEERFRRQGIGRALLQTLMIHLVQEQVSTIDAEYYALSSIAPFELLLASCGWSAPILHSHYYRFELQRLKQAEWLKKDRLPRRYRVLPWSNVLAKEIAALPITDDAGFRVYFRPDRQLETIDKGCSFILMDGEEPAGWSIIDREVKDVLLYRAVYLREAYRKSWLGISLAVHSSNAGLATGITHGVIQVREGNQQMQGIMQRLVLPLEPKVTEYRAAFKKLML